MDEELLNNLHVQVSALERDIKYIKSETTQLELILQQKDEEISQERDNQRKLLHEKDNYLNEMRNETKEIDDIKKATEFEHNSSEDLSVTKQKLLQEKQAQESNYRTSIESCDNELKRLEALKMQKDINSAKFYSNQESLGALASVYNMKKRAFSGEEVKEECKEE